MCSRGRREMGLAFTFQDFWNQLTCHARFPFATDVSFTLASRWATPPILAGERWRRFVCCDSLCLTVFTNVLAVGQPTSPKHEQRE